MEFHYKLRKFHWINEKKEKRFINQWHSFVNRHYFRCQWKIRVYNVSFEYASSCVRVCVRVEWKLSYHTANNIRNKFLYTIWSMRMLLFSLAFRIQAPFSSLSSFLYIWIAMKCDKNRIRTHTHTHSHWIAISRYTCICAYTSDKRSKRNQ